MTPAERAMEILVRGHKEPPGIRHCVERLDHRLGGSVDDRRRVSFIGSLTGVSSQVRRAAA